MKVGELIKRLQEFDANLEVAIRDGFNGGGQPRTINFGPIEFNPMDPEQHFSACDYVEDQSKPCTCRNNDALDYSDIESPKSKPTVHMGYGFY